ncbi:MAG: hypothetical protein ACK4NC_00660 [Candidatus Gracilibacteria bacterium]
MHITHKISALSLLLLVGSFALSQVGPLDFAKASINSENGVNYPETSTGNLLDDAGFESGIIGANVVGSREAAWRLSNGFEGRVTSSTQARTGSKAIEVKRWGVGQVVAIKGAPKSTFTYSVWAKSAAANTSPQYAVIELTHQGPQGKQNYGGVLLTPGDPTWKKIEVSYTIPDYPSYGSVPGFVVYLWQNCSAENCYSSNGDQGIIYDDAELKVTSGNAYLVTGDEAHAKIGSFYNQKWNEGSTSYKAANAFLAKNPDMKPLSSSNFSSEAFLSQELNMAFKNGIQFFAYDFSWNFLSRSTSSEKNYALNYNKAHPESKVGFALHLNLTSELLLAKDEDINALGLTLAANYTSASRYLKGEDGRPMLFIGGYTEEALKINKEKIKRILELLKQRIDPYFVFVFSDANTLTNGITIAAKEAGFEAYVMKSQISYVKEKVGNVLTYKTFHDLFETLAHATYSNSGLNPIYPSVRAFYDTRFDETKEPIVVLGSSAKWFMYSLHVAKNTISSINAVNPLFMLDGWNDLDEGSTLLSNERYGTSMLDQVKILSTCVKAKLTDESCWLYK